MASEAPKDLPVRPAAEFQAQPDAAAPPNAKSKASQAQPDATAPPSAKSKATETDVLPDWLIERNRFFEELWQKQLEETKNRPHPDINVTLDIGDGKPYPVPAKAFETTPASFLRDVPKEFSADVVVAEVNGELWDLSRPLETDSKVKMIPFSDPEGRKTFWHSAAHCLGGACEEQWGARLSHGPPTNQGYFYDMSLPEGRVVTHADWPALEKRTTRIYKEKQSFDRLTVSKEDLKKMFSYSKYKLHYIDKLVTGESTTVYRQWVLTYFENGLLVDLCTGPHIAQTGRIKASRILQNSSAYFLGDQSQDSLQRIRGVAFPDKKGLADHMKFLEEAEKRNHLKIGKEQELFFFDDVSPGSPFLLPNGVIIFNAIQKLLREEYRKRNYQEVQTPNMFNVDLWKKSGHWAHYKDDMFKLNVEKGEWALKPMNCPAHFTMFGHRTRTYRELPMRIADFGVLHRNEASGALSGLTRVRKFQQDDTHIFCAQDQIAQEIDDLFDFLDRIYGLFGFTFKLKLSTRPDKYMGELETWNYAEEQLKQCLTRFKGDDWTIDEGDGAFYGPKIDITIADALQREFQCATIQLDYQAPINFDLQYTTNEAKSEELKEKDVQAEKTKPDGLPFGRARPVVIHRAIIGSYERFLGIITEHHAGRFPFWLSPRQILIVPVMPAVNDYAEELQKIFRADKLNVDIDIGPNTLQKKIRNGQLAQYNFILVVGANEKTDRAVNVRNRDDPATQKQGVMIPLDEVRVKFKALRKERRLENAL
ncbi:threonyl-tRNA synthetase [Penicillium herquei]|nr:threonyl-tRNA synthetase [Penicillium herquei]